LSEDGQAHPEVPIGAARRVHTYRAAVLGGGSALAER